MQYFDVSEYMCFWLPGSDHLYIKTDIVVVVVVAYVFKNNRIFFVRSLWCRNFPVYSIRLIVYYIENSAHVYI